MNESGPILEFDSVRLERTDESVWDVGLEPVSFRLERGGRRIVALERGRLRHPLPALACGTLPPDSGTVRFLGAAWSGLDPDAAAANRGRIGQVFGGTGWISNLNLDENITLPLRYHRRLSPAHARDAAMEWARFFGLDRLPSERPGRAGRESLQLSQWIRAFALRPDLLLLDRPADGLSIEWNERLTQAVMREQARGAAALWLTETPDLTPPVGGQCRGNRVEWKNPQPGENV